MYSLLPLSLLRPLALHSVPPQTEITNVRFFTGLTELVIMQQITVDAVDGLDACPMLESLWITECSLTRIQGLSNCTRLKNLHLSTNNISRIENIFMLTELEVLWLNENQIKVVEGLETLTKLKSLWIARNQLETIGTSLDHNLCLKELNLSGNFFGSFRELLNLNRLPVLRSVIFSDPHFGDNPVCNLCNYQTYLLYHLSNLEALDSVVLSEDSKLLAEATFMKKKMYYNMRIKTLKRNTNNVIRKAADVRSSIASQINSQLAALSRAKKVRARSSVRCACAPVVHACLLWY